MAFAGFLFGAVVDSTTQGAVSVTAEDNTTDPHISKTFYVLPFNHSYMKLSSWKSSPNQREEIRAYREENTRNLTRETAAGMKSKLTFTTRSNLHLADKQALLGFFTDGELRPGGNVDQRKIQLVFWNDETSDYHASYFYRPNMNFQIIKLMASDLIYDAVEISLVEY